MADAEADMESEVAVTADVEAGEEDPGATITSIEGTETGVGAADEGSNTVQRPDSPDIISTYTANEESPAVEAQTETEPEPEVAGTQGEEDAAAASHEPAEPLEGEGAEEEAGEHAEEEAAENHLPAEEHAEDAAESHLPAEEHTEAEEPAALSGDAEDSHQPEEDEQAGNSTRDQDELEHGEALPKEQPEPGADEVALGDRPASRAASMASASGAKPAEEDLRSSSRGSSRQTTAPAGPPPPVSPPVSPPTAPPVAQPAPPPSPPALLEQLPVGRPSAPVAYHHANLKAIDVEINQGPDLPYKMIRVMLDYSEQHQKSYLGGFKNKRTGAVFHHVWTQTPKQPKYLGAERKLERETQTVKIAQRSAQTTREASTQMERPGIIVDTSEDRYVVPGRYQTSEERLAIVTAATCTIQRFWRGYRGRVRAEYLRMKKVEREAFLREQERQAKQEAEEHRRKEIERRMHPRTAADFEILYNELEAWRLQETRKIKLLGLPKEKEHEVLQQLLHKETKLLQTIDRLKINANGENKDVRIQKTLTEMGKPKKFELKNGQVVEVHTPFTTRAMELMQLYNGLNLPMLSIDERLDVLLHVKWTVKEFDCNLTREVVELIEREADLLNRGRNPKLLEGLRKRISSLFLTFIETPEFNPESSRFQIVPMEFESYMFEKLEKSRANVTIANKLWE